MAAMASDEYIRKSVVTAEEAKLLQRIDDLHDRLHASEKEIQRLETERRAFRYAQPAPEQGNSDENPENHWKKMYADSEARNARLEAWNIRLEAEVAKLKERPVNSSVQILATPPQPSNNFRDGSSIPPTPEPSDFVAPRTPISPQKNCAAPKSKGKGKQMDVLDLTAYDDDDDEVKEINVKTEIIDLDPPEELPRPGRSTTRRDGTPPPARAAKRRREEEIKVQAAKRARPAITGQLQQALATFSSAGPSRLGPRRGAPSLFPGGETAPSHAACISEASTRSTTPTVVPGDDAMLSEHSIMETGTGRDVLTDVEDGPASPMTPPDEPMDIDNATPEDVKPPTPEPDLDVKVPMRELDTSIHVPAITGSSIANYLSTLQAFPIDAGRHRVFRQTRSSLSGMYGGSPQRMTVDIVPGKSHDGQLQHWIFPQLEMNTAMPTEAGKHGLLFATRREFDDPTRVWKVWSGSGTKPKLWEYCGDYVVRETGQLKGDLWNGLSTKAKETWAKKVILSYRKAKAKGNDGKEIASDAYVKIYQRIQERLGKGAKVESEDIQRAFKDGDEHIRILTAFCIGFDYALVEHLSANTGRASVFTKARKRRAAKGKRQESVTDNNVDPKNEDDDTVVAEPPSQPRQSGRLRHRPVKNLREVSLDDDDPIAHVDDNAWGEAASDSDP